MKKTLMMSALTLSAGMAAHPATASTCAAFVSPSANGTVVHGYAEINGVHRGLIAEITDLKSGRLVQVVQMVELAEPLDAVDTAADAADGFAPVVYGSYAAPAAFEVGAGLQYRIAIRSDNPDEFLCASVIGDAGLAPIGPAASLSIRLTSLGEGHFRLSGEVVAGGAVGIAIKSGNGRVLQFIDLRHDPLTGAGDLSASADISIPPQVVTFSTAATFHVGARDVYRAVVLDRLGRELLSGQVHALVGDENYPASFTHLPGRASRAIWSYGTAGTIRLPKTGHDAE